MDRGRIAKRKRTLVVRVRDTRRFQIVVSPNLVLAAEAVDDAGLKPEIVLRFATEVSVKVVDLDGSQRDVLGQGNIGAAACGHRERVARPGACPRDCAREAISTGKYLDEREDAATGHREIDSGTKQVAEFVRGEAGRQPGDFAAAELADDPNAGREIGANGAGTTLAILAAGPVSGIEADELVGARNVKAAVFLGAGCGCADQ